MRTLHVFAVAMVAVAACGTAPETVPDTTTGTTSETVSGCGCSPGAHQHSTCFHLGAGGGEPTECAYACDEGWADCDGDKPNGCEKDVSFTGTCLDCVPWDSPAGPPLAAHCPAEASKCDFDPRLTEPACCPPGEPCAAPNPGKCQPMLHLDLGWCCPVECAP